MSTTNSTISGRATRSGLPPCSGCGRAYDATQWSALQLIKRLDASDLLSVVRPWPSHCVVEARACAFCGRAMSRVEHTPDTHTA